MGVGRIFSGGAIVDFSRGTQKDFSRSGAEIDKISFHPLETKKPTLFC